MPQDDGLANVHVIIHISLPCYDCYGEEISWDLVNENGNIIALEQEELTWWKYYRHNEGSTQQQEICLVLAVIHLITDGYGDGLGGSEFSCGLDGTPFSITDQNGKYYSKKTTLLVTVNRVKTMDLVLLLTHSASAGEPVYGCTDPLASN